MSDNPVLAHGGAPYDLPAFDRIDPSHFLAAFEVAMDEHNQEIAAIVEERDPATFDNVVKALEAAGAKMSRAGESFWLLASTGSTPEIQAIERDLAPKMAAHYSAIGLNDKLFARVADLWERRESLSLSDEQRRLLELTFESFKRSGARLNPEGKRRYGEIAERLATLYAQFTQNVLADENDWAMILQEGDLEGLPPSFRDSAKEAARTRNADGYVVTLSRSSVEPFLTFSRRRDLREKAFHAWTRRGAMSEKTDNRPIINEIFALRQELAQLLGYPSFAHYKLEDQMARAPENVEALFGRIWRPALAQAACERAILQEFVRREGDNFTLAAHDWRYYAAQARQERYALDEAQLRAYLSLDNVIAAAFDCAHKLFGVTFTEIYGLKLHHPDARAFEARDANGALIAVFIGDYFARPGKRGGAWMSAIRSQHRLSGERRMPVVVNVTNFAKGSDGPTLVSLDDARTLFHEFGHGLHGMLSDVVYPSLSGTGVARDFVEFPSQLYEHWFLQPEVLKKFALHHETREPMPQELIEKLAAAHGFNQGCATVEYMACALMDLRLHSRTQPTDVMKFQDSELQAIEMPDDIVMRHACPHFLHLFSGDGYSSGYYSYLWSEVLDADGFRAFTEKGDIFDAQVAQRLKQFVYSAGGREAPDEAYRHFRGRDPDPEALLEKKGFAHVA